MTVPCSLTFRTLQPRLRLANHFFRMRVLVRIFAGFVPELVTAIQLALRRGGVDLFRLQGALGKNGDSLGKNFHETASYVEALLAGLAAMQANFARAQHGEQRS